ncbi:MAG TPA: SRPBCC domain-containing protein [Kofleriaceae bacterium]
MARRRLRDATIADNRRQNRVWFLLPNDGMRELTSPIEVSADIEIDAPAAAVWQVLTDLRRFSEWNPFIRRARGELALGGDVHVRVRSTLHVPLAFHARVVAREHERRVRWQGEFLSRWLGSGDHTFTIEPIGEHRCRFAQREYFAGLLPRLATSLLVREAKRGFDAMNQALKARAEQLAESPARARPMHA